MRDGGVFARCPQLGRLRLVPLDEQFAKLRGRLRRRRLTPNGAGADPPAFLPSITVPASPVSRQQHAESHSTRGLTVSFLINHVLIWNKHVPASVFIEKKSQAFCISSALVIMSHSLDA